MGEGTSAYWRKLLEIDKPVSPDILEEYKSLHRYLRPLFYWIVGIPLKFYCPEKVYGFENLPDKPPYILAPNHGSVMDFVVIAYALGKRKEELYPLTTRLYYDSPWLLFWIKVVANAVRIDTVEDFFPALRVAVQILRAGKAVYIQPEGLRTTDGSVLPFRPGVGVLAVETGVPLVPAYLHNTWEALPTGSVFPRPYPVSVSFGKPIEMKSYQEKLKTMQAYDVYRGLTEDLRDAILELKEEIEHGLDKGKPKTIS